MKTKKQNTPIQKKDKIFTCKYCNFTALRYEHLLEHIKEEVTLWNGHTEKSKPTPIQQDKIDKLNIPKLPKRISGLKKDNTRDKRYKAGNTIAEIGEYIDQASGTFSYVNNITEDKIKEAWKKEFEEMFLELKNDLAYFQRRNK